MKREDFLDIVNDLADLSREVDEMAKTMLTNAEDSVTDEFPLGRGFNLKARALRTKTLDFGKVAKEFRAASIDMAKELEAARRG